MDDLKASEAFQKLLSRLPNKYLLVLIPYLVYMIFFDSNDLRSQYRLWKEVRNLKNDKVLLEQKLQQVVDERTQLFTDMNSLEKFAREQYFMKKEGETVFVIVEE